MPVKSRISESTFIHVQCWTAPDLVGLTPVWSDKPNALQLWLTLFHSRSETTRSPHFLDDSSSCRRKLDRREVWPEPGNDTGLGPR